MKFGTLMNIDSDALAHFLNTVGWEPEGMREKIDRYFDRYENRGISDLIFNLGPCVPSTADEWAGARYLRREEQGLPVDYSQNKIAKASHLLYTELGLDPFAVWLNRTRRAGMRPWISFRMNDVHYANEPTGHSAFFYRAKANGWMVGDYHHPRNWYGYALDYSVPEVRDHFLAIIEEQTQAYDAFGIDLDFQRTIRCFRENSPKNRIYMMDFLRRVREILNRAEQKWGHPWQVMLRLCTRVKWAYNYGFDVACLAREGLVNVFVPSAYWGSTDSNIPISEWKALCPPEVSVETVAGYRLMAAAAGADGFYQYNTFGAPWAWKYAAAEDARKEPLRRFLTVMNDIPVPLGWSEPVERYLPLEIPAGGTATLDILTDRLGKTEQICLYVGLLSTSGLTADEVAAQVSVSIDGVLCAPLGRTGTSYLEYHYADRYAEQENGRYPWRIFTFKVPPEKRGAIGTKPVVAFSSPSAAKVCYFELANGKIPRKKKGEIQ